MKKIIQLILRAYRVLSPMLWLPGPYTLIGSGCKFYPSCGEYAEKAVERYGVFQGLFLGLWRVLRCNPFNNGGIDDVP